MVINKTVAAISTPLAVGGISIVRISGEKAIEIADKVFKSASGEKLCNKKGYTASFGAVYDGEEQLDTSIATVFRAPKSYTGEDVVELSCHGGIFVTKELLRAVIGAGASPAGPGEFTKRAFINGKTTLTQAEAVADMLTAENAQAQNAAREQLGGALFRSIQQSKDKLLKIAGHLSAWVDYPEEDIPDIEENALISDLEGIKEDFERLLSTFEKGKIIREGIETVIIGKPNVGKSTLMNLLSGGQKSIVTDIAGTTRDIVNETINTGEVTLRLSDTAGIRETSDKVEQIGVDLAREKLHSANLVIAVFDSSLPFDNEDETLIKETAGKHSLAVINKSDLEQRLDKTEILKAFSAVIEISANDEISRELLFKAINDQVKEYQLDPAAGILANERQFFAASEACNAVKDAANAVKSGITLDAVEVAVETAIEYLLELSGQSVTEEVVNQVFSHFCVGK